MSVLCKQIQMENRIPQLDFLRGLAILLVLGRHHPVHATQSGMWFPLAGVWQRFGWAGVDLFFLLSGFLIGNLLLDELKSSQTIDFKRFFVRRLFRIWPAYYVFVAFVVIVNFKPNPHWLTYFASTIPMLTHTQNYCGAMREHLWSLSVEEHFYLVLPFVLLWAWKNNSKYGEKLIPGLCIGVTIFCLISRTIAVLTLKDFYPGFTWTHNRIDTLMTGVLVAYFYQRHKATITEFCRRNRTKLMLVGLAFIAPMMVLRALTIPFVFIAGLPMLAAGFSIFLLVLLSTPLNDGKLGKFLASTFARVVGSIGVISYAVYLWHCDVSAAAVSKMVDWGWFAHVSLEVQWAVVTVVCVSLSLIAGWISTMIIEQPILSLRKKVFPSRSSVVAPTTGSEEQRSLEPEKQLLSV